MFREQNILKNSKSWSKSEFLKWLGWCENGKYKKFCQNFTKYLEGKEISIKSIADPFVLRNFLKFDKREENEMLEILKKLMSISEENVVISRPRSENKESDSRVFVCTCTNDKVSRMFFVFFRLFSNYYVIYV